MMGEILTFGGALGSLGEGAEYTVVGYDARIMYLGNHQ